MYRVLYLTAEPCPTFRADVTALFGYWLPRWNVFSDIVAESGSSSDVPAKWGGGAALLCRASVKPLARNARIAWHSLRQLLLLNVKEYDAVQVRDMPVLGLLALIVARIKRLPFYYWMSYPMPEGHLARARAARVSSGVSVFLRSWIRGMLGKLILYRVLLPAADHIFVQSDRMKLDMEALGLPGRKMTPVPMGVDLQTMIDPDILPVSDSRLFGRRVLVYLGTMDPSRSIEVLLDTLVEIRREEPKALLLLVGDTSDSEHRRWLRQYAKNVGVEDHVIWTGWVPMKEAWRYLISGEVAFSPIPRGPLLDVGSPTKVVEYLAFGIPVVCNDNPDQQALIQVSGAGLCVKYDALSFAQAALELLNEPDARRELRMRSGRMLVEAERSYEVIARKLAKVYQCLQVQSAPRKAPHV